MPALSRWFIKTALLYLVAALGLGLLMSLAPALRFPDFHPVYVHLLVVGWLTQLIFGVAYWLFPRHSRAHPYGPHAWRARGAYALLNGGLLLRVVAEPLLSQEPVAGPTLVASALLQSVGVLLYVVDLWPRVRGK